MVRSSEVGKVWVLKSKRSFELGICVTCCMRSPVSHPALGPYQHAPGPRLACGSGRWECPGWKAEGRRSGCCFPNSIFMRVSVPHLMATLPSQHLLWTVLFSCSYNFLPCFVRCGDNNGCVDISLRLLLHTCHAFVTSPFLNRGTYPWIASTWWCPGFSIRILRSSNLTSVTH